LRSYLAAETRLDAQNSETTPRLDASGNVYVTGQLNLTSGAYPLVNPVQAPTPNPNGTFVTEYDPTGSTIYFSTDIYSPMDYGVYPSGIDADLQGNIYVAGFTYAPDLPTTAGAFQPAINGIPGSSNNYDGFIAKSTSLFPLPRRSRPLSPSFWPSFQIR
jgi:hypothetical protein